MSDVRKALQKFVKTNMAGARLFVAVVTDVNDDDRTCNLAPVDGNPEIFNARLKPTIGGEAGIYAIPVIGSFVFVAELGNENNVFVIAVNDAEKYVVNTEAGGTIELNGNKSSMVKAEELITQLNKTTEVLQTIQTVLTGWIPVPGDGGLALSLAIQTALLGKTVGTYTNIKNEKVKHG